MAAAAPPARRKPARTRGTAARAAVAWLGVLSESANQSPLKIDRDAGIIYGVKVLGRHSPNCHGIDGVTEGTEYTPEAMRAALPLYEGAKVKTNHPADRRRPTAERDVDDTFGQLRECRLDPAGDGIRGDLHYLKSHPMAARVLEDVERGLGVFGLSHNARPGAASVRGGRFVIEQIAAVESVDLVDKPATNRNLWESVEPTMKRVNARQFLEGAAARLLGTRREAVRQLLEDDAVPAEMEMADPAAEEGGDYKADLLAAVAKLLDDDGEESQGLVTKIMGLLKPKKAAPPVEESDDEGDKKDEKKDDEKDAKDAKKGDKLESVERREAVLALCESLDFTPPASLRKALVALDDDADRKALIADHKKALAAAGSKPRSRLSGNVTESREDDYTNDTFGRATRVPAGAKN